MAETVEKYKKDEKYKDYQIDQVPDIEKTGKIEEAVVYRGVKPPNVDLEVTLEPASAMVAADLELITETGEPL